VICKKEYLSSGSGLHTTRGGVLFDRFDNLEDRDNRWWWTRSVSTRIGCRALARSTLREQNFLLLKVCKGFLTKHRAYIFLRVLVRYTQKLKYSLSRLREEICSLHYEVRNPSALYDKNLVSGELAIVLNRGEERVE